MQHVQPLSRNSISFNVNQKQDVDFLLPTGVIIVLNVSYSTTLAQTKTNLWKQAENYPLFSLLLPSDYYIFKSITQDYRVCEFYDEGVTFGQLNLFQPFLKLIKPSDQRDAESLDYVLSSLMGIAPINVKSLLNSNQVYAFQERLSKELIKLVQNRESNKYNLALYEYPQETCISWTISPSAIKRVDMRQIFVIIRIIMLDGNQDEYLIELKRDTTASSLICDVIRRKIKHSVKITDKPAYVNQHKDTYVLKICGLDQILLLDVALLTYKYVENCILNERKPIFILLSRDTVYDRIVKEPLNMVFSDTYFQKNRIMMEEDACNSILAKQKVPIIVESLHVVSTFRIFVDIATYVVMPENGNIFINCGIFCGSLFLCENVNTTQVSSSNPKWKEWLNFNIKVCDLSRNAILSVSLIGTVQKQKKLVETLLSWINIPLFDYEGDLIIGKKNFSMWKNDSYYIEKLLNYGGITDENGAAGCTNIELLFEEYFSKVIYPKNETLNERLDKIDAENMNSSDKDVNLCQLMEKKIIYDKFKNILKLDQLADISVAELQSLWQKRYYFIDKPTSYPRFSTFINWSNYNNVFELYAFFRQAKWANFDVALELLDGRFVDERLRKFAVDSLRENANDEELILYMIQLVQALKSETYIDNNLVQFLLERAILNQRLGHCFYWNLRSEIDNCAFAQRFTLYLEIYCRYCGSFAHKLKRQVRAMDILSKISGNIKCYREDLQVSQLVEFISEPTTSQDISNILSPLNITHSMGMLIKEKCKVMSSKKKPLWLVWSNSDYQSESYQRDFRIIFKNGDDLRQDMLTLQILSVIDGIWKSEGFDMKLIPYGCISIGKDLGIIEIVKNATTVFSIQKNDVRDAMQVRNVELHRWVKDNNKSKLDYDKAIKNFTYSCAGYCVATFILGIGDRHNDNIMLTKDGHVFHIDFGHFLDHRKKKFGINRERVPFVLTEDFLRVIARGAENPERSDEFKHFTKLCGSIYLILRKHARKIINLLIMMLPCGISELSSTNDIQYVRKTMAIGLSEKDALTYFEQHLRDAYMEAWTTKIDWFFHWANH